MSGEEIVMPLVFFLGDLSADRRDEVLDLDFSSLAMLRFKLGGFCWAFLDRVLREGLSEVEVRC